MLLTAAYAAAVLSNAALGTHISRYERDTESSVSEGVCGVVKSGTEYTSLTVSFTRNGTNMTYSWSMETTGDCVTFLDDVLEPCESIVLFMQQILIHLRRQGSFCLILRVS